MKLEVVPLPVAHVDALAGRGVEVSEIQDLGGGVKHAYFGDPDGNSWVLQETPMR
jgi:hypothetical protein